MLDIDIQYTWLLLFLPLVVAAFNWFFLTKRANVAALTSTFSCLVTFVLSLALLDKTGTDAFTWLSISSVFSIDLGFVLDPLSTRMMLVVTASACWCISSPSDTWRTTRPRPATSPA